jgi:hypothetical protein
MKKRLTVSEAADYLCDNKKNEQWEEHGAARR